MSIKDQVVRACALVDSLKAANKLTQQPELPAPIVDLVVIGAGAAGVTAAWRATQLGAKVLVVESSDKPFSVQRNCQHRHVSLSMYDWPEVFADAGAFPSLGDQPVRSTLSTIYGASSFPCVASTWTPQYAHKLVEEWDKQLELHPIGCEWRFNTRASPALEGGSKILSDDLGFVHVKLTEDGKEPVSVYPLNVILATGIGHERTLPESVFQSTPFWRDDLRAPWASLVDPNGKKVVVSGSGDGAIQDVLKSLLIAGNGDLIPIAEALFTKKQLPVIKAKLCAIERHAERQLLWGVSDRDVYRAMQAAYDAIVSDVPTRRISQWRRKYLRQDGLSVQWVMLEGRLFTKTYPLNRLLASVLLRSEFTSYVSFVEGRIKAIIEQPASPSFWRCTLEDGSVLESQYPPMLRNGIEVMESEQSGDDLKTLRAAISRAPVPFKPFDF
ncbi:FAD-dependent oxidoreductase [Paraburkholderia tropica]|uniref:FAD-dependent oxidoreductase n=1 Tax=Paraburkholderia tropica TaxID=92647 RepID=UPI002ABD81BD|nr:FAD-dependent oxidoreductase [Paraburkholderia tropica]